MKHATDQKKRMGPPATKGKAKAPAKDAREDRDRLGAILRPEAADRAGPRLEVGGTRDRAEAEADRVADAVAAPEPAAAAEKGTAKEPEEGGRFRPQARGPPPPWRHDVAAPVRRVPDQNGDQPDTDSLATVPAVEPRLADVSLAAAEDSELDELSDGDFATLGEGQSAVMMKPMPQAGDGPAVLPASLSRLILSPGPGQPLPAPLRARMERRLGHDLSTLRLHTGGTAARLASHLQARAFAHGSNIWLRNAADASDLRLIAHETAHCIQQGATRPLSPQARAPPLRGPHRTAPLRRLQAPSEPEGGLLARGAESLADKLDSYALLKVLIGRRLFTGETVQQDPLSYVGAFMQFVGAKDTFEQMRQSGSLERGFRAIREGAEAHDLTWARVRRIYDQAYDQFEWTAPVESLSRIFGPFLRDVLAFGALVLRTVAELVAEAFVIGFGPLGREVWDKIKAIGDVIDLVLENPMGFAMNLLRAVGLGIEGFGMRILSHIKKGLLAWVLGPFAQMGVQLPERLDLRGIISVLLQVLGLTYPQLRPRLVRKLNPHGDLKVTAVERLIEVLDTLRTEGLAGVWRKFLEYVSNLQMTVVNAIRDWVVRAVIEAGIRKLVAWSNPAGALLDILFTIYKLIVFFVEKFQQILSFASSVFDSIGKIARGQLHDAATAIEATLAKTIPILISFLTSLLGLPDVAGAVRRVITALRERVHAAVDKVLDFLIGKIKKLIAALVARFKSRKGEPEGDVTMQGTRHKLAFEPKGTRRELVLRSEPAPVTPERLEGNGKAVGETCPDAYDKTEQALAGAAKKRRASEAAEAKLAGKPEQNAAAPKEHVRRERDVADTKAALEAATDKSINATEAVASGKADLAKQPAHAEVQPGQAVPPEQKPTVEAQMKDLHFRYIIVPEGSTIEGSWGPWQAMQKAREEFKAEMAKRKLDGRFTVDLDHNPEYQILWRLGHLAYGKDQREEGEERTQEARLFPTIAALYGSAPLPGTKRERKGSDLDRVMAIRYDAHRALADTQGGVVATFNRLCVYNETQQAFVPRKDRYEDIRKTDWKGLIETAANEHQSELVSVYATLEQASFVNRETVDQIRKSGEAMVAQGLAIVGGSQPADLKTEAAKGHMSGIGMTEDPVNAELLANNYGVLPKEIHEAAPNFHFVFDKHHMIEADILKKLQGLLSEVRLLPSLADPSTPVAGLPIEGPPLGAVAEAEMARLRDRIPALAGTDPAQQGAALVEGAEAPPQRGFPAGAVESKGYAVSVLRKVNGVLGRQPESNIDEALRSHLKPKLDERAARARTAVGSGLGGLSVPADAPPEKATEALAAATAGIRAAIRLEATEGVAADLQGTLPAVIDQLTGKAHGAFVDEYRDALLQTHPPNGIFPEDSTAFTVMKKLKERFEQGPGNIEKVQNENRKRWAKV